MTFNIAPLIQCLCLLLFPYVLACSSSNNSASVLYSPTNTKHVARDIDKRLGIDSKQLFDVEWSLESYSIDTDEKIELIPGTSYYLSISSSSPILSGTLDCNTYFADYSLNRNALSIFNLQPTNISCLAQRNEYHIDQKILVMTVLENIQYYHLSDDALTLRDVNNAVLNFKKN